MKRKTINIQLNDNNILFYINGEIYKEYFNKSMSNYKIINKIKFIEQFKIIIDNYKINNKLLTDNINIICLMKNGLSYYLSKNIVEDYFDYVDIDLENNTIVFKPAIIEEMKNDDANEILIFELEQFIK